MILLKSAHKAYCHDGISRSQVHMFENENYPDIMRCIKCGWYMKKLKDSTFSAEEFVNLLNDVEKRTLVDDTKIDTKRSRLNLTVLKRNSSMEKIKEDIDKLAKRISLKTKDVFNKVQTFFK